MITLPAATVATTEYEDFYESTLAQPVNVTDTDIYPVAMPASAIGFLVLDPYGTNPEIIYYTVKGTNYVRVPSAADGEGRGVGNTTPRQYDSGTKIGMYSIAEFFEGLANGLLMRDGFLQSRHFGAGIDPNSWIGTGESWNYVGSNGNKETQYVTAGDKRTKYSKGMKVRMPRVTAVGTQSAKFVAASSQFAKKTSPSNVNVGNTFTIEAWVNPDDIRAVHLVARRDATNGYWLETDSHNRLVVTYASAGQYTAWKTYQSLIPGQKVHVAAVVSSVSGKTIQGIYINGVAVSIMNAANAATAITNTGDLAVGAYAVTPAGFWNGTISEVRIWSTARTDAEIKANYQKTVASNATGLIAYFPLNGNFNDSTANANHLTAQGGATATFADYPFVATEYGFITDLSFAAGNTTITVWTGNIQNAPAENLNGVSYSAAKSPYGFPTEESVWTMYVMNRQTDSDFGIGSFGQWYDSFRRIILPTGKWKDLTYEGFLEQHNTSSGTTDVRAAFSTTYDSSGIVELSRTRSALNGGFTYQGWHTSRKVPDFTTTAMQIMTFIVSVGSGAGGVNLSAIGSPDGPLILSAKLAYS